MNKQTIFGIFLGDVLETKTILKLWNCVGKRVCVLMEEECFQRIPFYLLHQVSSLVLLFLLTTYSKNVLSLIYHLPHIKFSCTIKTFLKQINTISIPEYNIKNIYQNYVVGGTLLKYTRQRKS